MNGNPASILLYQMQRLFSTLQESDKKSADTREFCSSIKRDGEPINTLMQMDVDEFFAQLFDTLETELKLGGNKVIFSRHIFVTFLGLFKGVLWWHCLPSNRIETVRACVRKT